MERVQNGKFRANVKYRISVTQGCQAVLARVQQAKGGPDNVPHEDNQSSLVARKHCPVLNGLPPVAVPYRRYPTIISHPMWFHKNVIETRGNHSKQRQKKTL